MKTYLLVVESQGAYAADRFTSDNWITTEDASRAATVEASSAKAAMNKFCKAFGITVRYRQGDTSVTDRNLHGFSVQEQAALAEAAE